MALPIAHRQKNVDAGAVIHDMHGLVTYGPADLDVAAAMSTHGYDAVKWAEGQGMLAELVSADRPIETTLRAATVWYREAATAARQALRARPELLTKLGVVEPSSA